MLKPQFSTKYIPGGTFGLERETLRVTSEGNISHTLHPFPDDMHIVKDFCENQTEINTGARYAERVIETFGDSYVRKGLVIFSQ